MSPSRQCHQSEQVHLCTGKLIIDKIGIKQSSLNRYTKPGCEMMVQGQIKKLGQVKLLRKVKHTGTQWKEKTPKGRLQTSLSTQLEDINQKILVKEEDSKGTRRVSSNINKTGPSKTMKEILLTRGGECTDKSTTRCKRKKKFRVKYGKNITEMENG